jgi:hypothetical protein
VLIRFCLAACKKAMVFIAHAVVEAIGERRSGKALNFVIP